MESHQQGIRLLEQILEEKTWDIFTQNDIKHSDFYADSAQVLAQIHKYHKTYSELPPKDVLISKVKENCLGLHNFEFPEKIATEAVIDTFFEHKISRDFSEIMSQGKRMRLEDGVTSAANYIKKALADLDKCGKKEDTLNFAENAQERLKKYNNKKWETATCVLSPWKYFNDTLGGWDTEGANHVIVGQSGTGKALRNDEPILCENGWKTHGTIVVGDRVYGADGELHPVTAVHPQGEIETFKVSFSDGTSVMSCKDHLWKVYTPKRVDNNNKYGDDRHVVLPLSTIMKDYKKQHVIKSGKDKGRTNYVNKYSIPLNSPINYPRRKLEIDPYLLGLLLGDGGFKRENITFDNAEQDVLEDFENKIKEIGMEVSVNKRENHTKLGAVCRTQPGNPLFDSLQKLGLRGAGSREKFIPQEYLTASIEQRRELLRGLINTDGSSSRGVSIRFSTYSEQLYHQTSELARSLGFAVIKKARDRTTEKSTKKYDKEIEYTVGIIGDFTKVNLSEKHSTRLKPRRTPYAKKIVNIESIGKAECTCISVDSENHLYITRDYIVTHNTWSSAVSALNAFTNGLRVLLISKENGEVTFLERLDSLYAQLPYGKMRRGELEFRSYNQYIEAISGISEESGKLFIEAREDRIQTVNQIFELSERHNVDLTIVDGAYLVKPSNSYESDSSNQKNLANEFQQASKAQPNTAWVTTLQLVPKAAEIQTGREQAQEIRGSREWFMTAASVLAMSASPDDRLKGVVKIAFGKGREMAEAPDRDFFYIKDDKVNSDFSEVDMSNFNDEELADLI